MVLSLHFLNSYMFSFTTLKEGHPVSPAKTLNERPRPAELSN